MSTWPVLDGVARKHLATGALVGQRVRLDVPADEATEHVVALLTTAGAQLVTAADLVLRDTEVVAGDRMVDVPLIDPTGSAHAMLRAVLRVTNRRLPGTRVAVAGFDPVRRELSRTVRALGGCVTVVEDDPLERLAASLDGHDVGTAVAAAIVFADVATDVPDGAVLAGPAPDAVGEVVDEPRPGLIRVRREGVELLVVDPAALTACRPTPWLDLMWATRLVTLAWVVTSADGDDLPIELPRELAAAALEARGA